VITARRTRLVRVADLHRFRHTIAALCRDDISTAVIVPTRAAANQLQRTIEKHAAGASPALITRDELYDVLAGRLASPPPRLSGFEREAIVRSASADAVAAGVTPPFQLRPGLVAEMVRFYDQLRRQRQSVARFEEILVESLSADIDVDRGAARMLQQTRFLAAVYSSYERRLADGGLVDEHALRERIIAGEERTDTCLPRPLRVVVSVADWIAEPGGLFHADFDLLARAPDIAAIDVVATVGVLGSGFHQRLHDWLPGLEEVDAPAIGVETSSPDPILMRPSSPVSDSAFVHRDREEELIAIARTIKAERAAVDSAVVFNRPLPYLYLASPVFGAAGIPYHTADALPLAAEPFVAALDLALEFVASQFTRASLVALLRSPHFSFSAAALDRRAIATLDRFLSDERYLGDVDRLRGFAAERADGDLLAGPLNAAVHAAERLRPLLDPAPASAQLSRLLEFLGACVAPAVDDRERRARSAVTGILEAMAAAAAGHDDRHLTIDELAIDIRRWIEDETFARPSAMSGVQLLDPQAARYGDFADLFLVGLIEG